MIDTIAANLAALPPHVAQLIRSASATIEPEKWCTTQSRTGLTVTGTVIDERPVYHHSVYDPEKEALRLVPEETPETLICLGFGSGHHLRPLYGRAERLIVVEPDARVVANALALTDLHDVLSRPALFLLAGKDTENLVETLSSVYRPALHGSIRTVTLTGAERAAPELVSACREKLASALDEISADFATQARFGRLWMRNTLRNLAMMEQGEVQAATLPSLSGQSVIVTAAGPSLETALPWLATRMDDVIIATDTSLPTLCAGGITPDAVMSIDCQTTGFHHYLTAGFPRVPVLADLAAPPSVMENAAAVLPLLSRHPLHLYLGAMGLHLPAYDSSGGNVTHGAVSFALSLSARDITVVGADFSYPRGMSYARSSYIHAWFGARATRITPVESGFYHFSADRPGAYRRTDSPHTVRTPVMDQYETALHALVSTSVTPVHMDPPGSNTASSGTAGIGRDPMPRASGSHSAITPVRFDVPKGLFARLAKEFSNLEDLSTPDESPLAMALLPLAAWQRRVTPEIPAGEIMARVKREALSLLQTELRSAP